MSEPTFILGVGAQKAGTTWLDHYLRAHPAARLGYWKEWHLFDALYGGGLSVVSERIAAALTSLDTPGAREWLAIRLGRRPAPLQRDDPALFYLRCLADPQLYFDHFQALLAERPGCTLTGDITPAYAFLPEAAFAAIRRELEARALRVRVVFLMRDPVARCISSARMEARMASRQQRPASQQLLDPMAAGGDWRAHLAEVHGSAHYARRTRYDRTVQALERVFEPEQLLFGFFEEMFDDAFVRRLSGFLGIEFRPGEYAQKANASSGDSEAPAALRQAIREHYAEVYEFVSRRFGAERVRRLWAHA